MIIDDYYETEARAAGKKEGESVEAALEAEGPRQTAADRRREAEMARDRSRRRPDAFTFNNSDLQGNPTITIFGDSGATPFERARGWNVRRANLQRLDLNEENWMLEMARMVRGMNSELAENRKERLQAFPRPYESIDEDEDDQKEDDEVFADEKREGAEEECEDGVEEDDEEVPRMDVDMDVAREVNGTAAKEGKRREYILRKKRARPVGIFEPATQAAHFASSTQPSRAWMERLSDRPRISDQEAETGARDLAVLGGAKVGGQGWGIATFDHAVALPRNTRRGIKNVTIPKGQAEEL